MQKPLQEYIRGLYGGYTSEAVRKTPLKTGGDIMDFGSLPITANPLDLALKLTGTEKMVPKPLSALPEYMDANTLNAIRTLLNVPIMGGGQGAEIRQASANETPSVSPSVSPSEAVAQERERRIALPPEQETEPKTVGASDTKSRPAPANIRNLWSQINSLGMSIPDPKRRFSFVANEIERMKAEGEIDGKTAETLHYWNNNLNAPEEQRGMDERLLWLLLFASMFQR